MLTATSNVPFAGGLGDQMSELLIVGAGEALRDHRPGRPDGGPDARTTKARMIFPRPRPASGRLLGWLENSEELLGEGWFAHRSEVPVCVC